MSGDITLATAFGADKGKLSSQLELQVPTISRISTALTDGFGDKRNEVQAIVMHSSHYNAIEADATAGFLKADANDPLYGYKGFVGRSSRWFGLAVFVSDTVPEEDNITITDNASATQEYKTYSMVFLKKDAFGLMIKQLPKIEYDRNIQRRKDLMVATQWYAVKGFHKIISTEDVRCVFQRFSSRKQA